MGSGGDLAELLKGADEILVLLRLFIFDKGEHHHVPLVRKPIDVRRLNRTAVPPGEIARPALSRRRHPSLQPVFRD
ncbi:hypothetical protein [Rhodoligotrophos defluvii]|uniref:hypothetical protein n=1 Tax=Rhodoligotrophos defluvii TaxID=2561934 RepID=UPI0010CA1181|nr:hypothetical protein [Rhodoligotrophos defluvii]